MRRALVAAICGGVALGGMTARPAVAAVDQPNTCAGLTGTSPNTTWQIGAIASPTDVDWYRFSLAASAGVVVTLGDLPANYRLDVYSACSTLLASSTRLSTQFEEAILSLAAGTYRVKVSSQVGASSATEYVLRFRTFATGVHISSVPTPWVDGDDWLHFPGEIFNNTSANRSDLEVIVRLYDADGELLDYHTEDVGLDVVRARSRAPFHLAAPRPEGYHHFSIAVWTHYVTDELPLAGVLITPGVATYDGLGQRHDIGTLTNLNDDAVGIFHIWVSLYNRRGGVINAYYYPFSPTVLDSGESGAYEVVIGAPNRNVNRTRVLANGEL